MSLIAELFSDKQTTEKIEWEKERKSLVSAMLRAREQQLNAITFSSTTQH